MRDFLFRHAETTVFGVITAVLAAAVVVNAAAAAEPVVTTTPQQVVVLDEVRLLNKRAADLNAAAATRSKDAEVKISALAADPDSYGPKSMLSAAELKSLLKSVGFEGQSLKTAWAIVMTESNGRPKAHNRNSNTGDNSYGLFQINMIGDLGPARRAKFGLGSNEDLFNPVKNAEIAYFMSAGGTNFSAWKVRGYNDGSERFENFLAEYPSE